MNGVLLAPEWGRDAACKDLEPEEADAYFFPERGHTANAARRLCATCAVSEQCLEFAMKHLDALLFGVWGGTTPRERRGLQKTNQKRRRRPPKRCHCGARAVGRGLCQLHYARERRQHKAST